MQNPEEAEVKTLRGTIRARREEWARRAYAMRTHGLQITSLPGSEHAHLLRRPRGF